MTEQTFVCVKNLLENKGIEVFRRHGDGTEEPDPYISIAASNEDTVHLPESGVSLIIMPPHDVDTGTCRFEVTLNEHLVEWTTNNNHWEIRMAVNNAPPEVPTTVNAEVGGDPP